MKHKIPVPEISELEALIAPACDSLPGPDPIRLQTIRDSLPGSPTGTRSQKSPNKVPWWIVLLLTGGLAAAAWMAGEFPGGDDTRSKSVTPAVETGTGGHNLPDNIPVQPPAESDQDQTPESPVIYQRENF